MGVGLEVVTGFVTAPGATITPTVACTGNSFTVRSAAMTSSVYLIGLWAFNQAVGMARVRSPRLHDNVQGIRTRVPASLVLPKYPMLINGGFPQFLVPQDTLIVEQTGSATGGQIESVSLLLYYTSLPGVSARLINWATLMSAGINVATVEASVTAVATGQYGGGVLVNAATQNLKANTDYALLGIASDTRGTTVRVSGVDFGNLGVGVPCEPSIEDITTNWFSNLAMAYNLALIPVFNSANYGGITIDLQTNQAAGTFVITLFIVELKAGVVPLASSGPNS